MFLSKPLAFWVREYIGDLLHERDTTRAQLMRLRDKRGADVGAMRRELLDRLNVLNDVTGHPRDVLDPQSERDRLEVAQGRKPNRFSRIEEFLRNNPEPR